MPALGLAELASFSESAASLMPGVRIFLQRARIDRDIDRSWIMNAPALKFLALSSFAAALALTLPGLANAQAAPGPISPSQSSDDNSQPAAQPKPQEPAGPPATRDNLSGTWKLNTDESDDGHEKLRAAQSQQNNGNNGNNGGGGRGNGGGGGGVWGGGGGGVGFPGGGGGGGYPGGGGGGYPGGGGGGGSGRHGGQGNSTETSDDRARMQELIDPPVKMTLALKDNEFDLADDENNKREFYTDGRKLKKSKDLTNQEIAAHWEQIRLVSDEKNSRGDRYSRSFEAQPGGKRLVEIVRIESNRQQSSVVIRYVYDLVPADKSGSM